MTDVSDHGEMRDTVDDMFEVIIDHDVDLDNRAEIMSLLVSHGFSTSAINMFMDDAIEEAREFENAIEF